MICKYGINHNPNQSVSDVNSRQKCAGPNKTVPIGRVRSGSTLLALSRTFMSL